MPKATDITPILEKTSPISAKELSTLEYRRIHPKHIPTITVNQIRKLFKFDLNSCPYNTIANLPSQLKNSFLASFLPVRGH